MSVNPYQPPSAGFDQRPNYAAAAPEAVLTPRIVEGLRKTRPWVMLLAILGMIGSGFTLLGALGFLVGSANTDMPAGFALFYVVIGAIYLVPTIALFKYGGAINKVTYGGGVPELEEAIDAQRSFWQIAGTMVIIGFVVGVIMSIAMVAAFAAMF